MVYGWLMSQGKHPSTRLYTSNSKWLARWNWQTFLFRATLQLPTEHILSFINLNTDRICLDLSRAMKWSTSWTPLKVMISLHSKHHPFSLVELPFFFFFFFRPFYFWVGLPNDKEHGVSLKCTLTNIFSYYFSLRIMNSAIKPREQPKVAVIE